MFFITGYRFHDLNGKNLYKIELEFSPNKVIQTISAYDTNPTH